MTFPNNAADLKHDIVSMLTEKLFLRPASQLDDTHFLPTLNDNI